jgi:hypothetical protein
MFKLRTRLFGATFESTFPHPIAFNQPYLAKLGESLSQSLSPVGLTPNQIECITTNVLFGYEVRFPLFRGNANYSLNPQRLRLDFTNAVGPADVTTIIDTVLKCLSPMDIPDGTNHFINVGRHTEFESPGDFEKFFSRETTQWKGDAVKHVGAILYLTLSEWPEEITVNIEPSIVISSGAFVSTRTVLRAPETEKALTAETFRTVTDIFEKAVSECNLELVWPS